MIVRISLKKEINWDVNEVNGHVLIGQIVKLVRTPSAESSFLSRKTFQ